TSGNSAGCKDIIDAQNHQYVFWDTQPVPKIDEVVTENTFIEAAIDKTEVRAEPYSLPDLFYWSDVDILNIDELTELYNLLAENYVEDDDNMFRFDYKPEFLEWALKPPGWKKKWHCGVRAKNNGKLLAFISAIPSNIRVYDQVLRMVEINFLCVHKKLRSKRVAPVLIREITRRVNQIGIFQAVFTAGVVLPRPIATCRYWHRSLNPKKLIEVKFSHLARKMTMQRTLKLYKLPEWPKTENLELMTSNDINSSHLLLSEYLKKFELAPIFSKEEFEHFFLPRPNVIHSYVVKNKEGKVTDLISYYLLPSSVMHHPQYKSIKAAYSFYNVATSVSLKQLINDFGILHSCINRLYKTNNFNLELKFGIGDGNLQYYLYNWKCPDIKPEKVGLVLQ
ncbi:unnamed protein product, partial [Dracunculus medinensis]|uniref:Glycylpeptide N-tetradecanoyltransferase n=1 Tax=Dracunculus medinensis TaxID=318479 RepID=A0A0N4U7U7_DRAME